MVLSSKRKKRKKKRQKKETKTMVLLVAGCLLLCLFVILVGTHLKAILVAARKGPGQRFSRIGLCQVLHNKGAGEARGSKNNNIIRARHGLASASFVWFWLQWK